MLSQSNPAKIPIYLLTGFLGSGKSTLLKSILSSKNFQKTLVIINEFGNIGVDHLLLGRLDHGKINVLLLESGCLCCSVQGELRDTLRGLAHVGNTTAPFDQIIIETTGLADPGPILAAIASDIFLAHHYQCCGVLTVADPTNSAPPKNVLVEWHRQIAAADTIYLSKTDLVDDDIQAIFLQRLSGLNPAADIVIRSEQALEKILVSLARKQSEKNTKFMRTIEKPQNILSFGRAGRSHLDGITTLSIDLPEEIDWLKFSIWFSLLLHTHGEHILRSKGIIRVAGYARPLVIHSVGSYLYPPEHHDAATSESMLVMIVCGLEAEQIKRSFSVMVED